MTREEKCKIAIEKGFIYKPETGDIIGIRGKKINSKLNGYICLGVYYNNKIYRLLGHQFAWYWINKEIVECLDHIDGNILNNKINNLRSVTIQKNNFNKPKSKGCYWVERLNKWRVIIGINYKSIHIGLYDTEEEGYQAYLDAKIKYHII